MFKKKTACHSEAKQPQRLIPFAGWRRDADLSAVIHHHHFHKDQNTQTGLLLIHEPLWVFTDLEPRMLPMTRERRHQEEDKCTLHF